MKKYKLNSSEVDYFVFSHEVTNDAYRPDKIRINILSKDGKIADQLVGAVPKSAIEDKLKSVLS